MKALASALVAGFVFGIGLWVSGMANPRKVLGFLDIAGEWDASLMLVMGGAVAVTVVAFRFILRRPSPLLEEKFSLPTKKDIDVPLVAGAAIFGIGWGMSGICPGPAISLVAFWPGNLLIYLLALFVGSYAGAFIIPRTTRMAIAQ